MKKLFLILGASTALAFSSCNDETKYQAFDKSSMDISIKPGNDFYRYINGNWIKNNPIPDDMVKYGAGEELDLKNRKNLELLLDSIANLKDAPEGSNTQKIKDFYLSGLDTARIEQQGTSVLSHEFELINSISGTNDLVKAIAHFQRIGISPLFYYFSGTNPKNSDYNTAQFWQGGLSLPDRDYYTKQDERSEAIRDEYTNHIVRLFNLLGTDNEAAIAYAKTIMKMETYLAEASNTQVENRDPNARYNKFSKEELKTLVPSFDWNLYFEETKTVDINDFIVHQPRFIESIEWMMKEFTIDDWKVFLTYKFADEASPYLTSAFVNESFNFYSNYLYGQEKQKSRKERIVINTSGSLSEAVGELYVAKFFPPQAKNRMLELVSNLKTALGKRIENVDWMSDSTRKQALEKLNTMGVKIGYPDKWKDYSALEIKNDSYMQNIFRIAAFNFDDNLAKAGKPVDKTEWSMAPQVVNAYYMPTRNEIVFPAGILQPPFFDMNADDAMNYGAIGAIIGHEMSHGFDDKGRLYDANGNLRDWWTKDDADKFTAKTNILVNQFNRHTILDSIPINGELTLGENIADLAGLTISFDAFCMTNQYKEDKSIDDFKPNQRFFISYARAWRKNIREQAALRMIQEDPHSPAEWRVNGTLYNFSPFYEAFPEIKEGDHLFVAVKDRAKIW